MISSTYTQSSVRNTNLESMMHRIENNAHPEITVNTPGGTILAHPLEVQSTDLLLVPDLILIACTCGQITLMGMGRDYV